MKFKIEAACGCNIGKIRTNNEDNFVFNGNFLESVNDGLKDSVHFEAAFKRDLFFAVFDGMGGENFGEIASYTAAKEMQSISRNFFSFLIPKMHYLEKLTKQLNTAVVLAKKEMRTDRMGTTMVSLHFFRKYAYVCNIGDSRAYRFRNGKLVQISEDHVMQLPVGNSKKAPLTQHLGIDPEDMLIEPFIAKGKITFGDVYLLCSDGLTDMLSDLEISNVLLDYPNVDECVNRLIQAALDKGGRDNVTTIVCRVNG